MVNRGMIKSESFNNSGYKPTLYKSKLAHIALDEMNHFVGLLDANGTLLEANRAALNAAGVKRSEVIGKYFPETIWWSLSAAARKGVENAIQRALAGEVVRYDVEVFGRSHGFDKVLIDFLLKPIKDENGKVIFMLAEGHDNTARRIREREIAHMFMQAPIGICALEGPDHVFSLANSTYLSILFNQKRDLIGKPLSMALPELKGKKIERHLDEVYQTGKSRKGTEMPIQIVQSDSSVRKMFTDFVYHPVSGINGKVKGVLVLITDVTEKVNARKKLEESETRFRSLTDTIPQLMWTTTPEGNLSYANERCLQYTGIDSIEKFGETWMTKIHPLDMDDLHAAWKSSVNSGKKIEQEYRMQNAEGNYRWFLGRVLPIRNKDKRIEYWIGTATDIDDQKKVLAELEVAKELAEHANATKSAFLANMSHEIRTPLGAILGFSGLLKDNNLSEKERDQYINTINRNGQSLTRIIDDILDLAKVEAGRLEVEEIDFSLIDLMNEVVDLFREKAKLKGIGLRLKIDQAVPDLISTDPTRLRQILINIIGNAVKFTAIDGIFVHVKLKQHIEGALRIDVFVRDTGPGLSEEQKSRLFKPFSQGDNTMTRQFGGTGLGLVLSQRLSQALGGGITIEDCAPGKGSTFVISFVATVSKKSALELLPVKETVKFNSKLLPLKDIKVLLVDDSLDNQFLVNRLLSKNGAWVELAGDGAQAVEKALANTYDIVLMDIQMPTMDGYQAIEVLGQKNYSKPVIALTAHAMLEDQLKTKAAGFAGHLTKPIDVNELIKSIKQQTIKQST